MRKAIVIAKLRNRRMWRTMTRRNAMRREGGDHRFGEEDDRDKWAGGEESDCDRRGEERQEREEGRKDESDCDRWSGSEEGGYERWSSLRRL